MIRPAAWEEEKITFRPFVKLQGRIDEGDIVKGAFGDVAGEAELNWERGLRAGTGCCRSGRAKAGIPVSR